MKNEDIDRLNKSSGALFKYTYSYYLKFLLYFCPISTVGNIQANENVNRLFSLLTYKALERIILNFPAIFLCPPTKISISVLDYQYPIPLAGTL